MTIKDNPPYTLFQGENGKWGTKDADGNVQDSPIYQRIERADGGVTYFDGQTTVCDFSPETGMELIAWYQPWWENAFLWASYPDEYDDFIWKNINANRQPGNDDGRLIAALMESLPLTAEQQLALSDLVTYCRWNDLPDDADDEKFEDEWFDSLPQILSPQQRIDCLAPLMRNDALTDDQKSTLWYANFCFIDTFICQL